MPLVHCSRRINEEQMIIVAGTRLSLIEDDRERTEFEDNREFDAE